MSKEPAGPPGSPVREYLLRALALLAPPSPAVIFAYHSIGQAPDAHTVSIDDFEAQLDLLRRRANVVPLEAVWHYVCGQGKLPARAVCVTFDDLMEEAVRNAVPPLQRNRMPATWFVPTGLLGQTVHMRTGLRRLADWDAVMALHREGFEIGGHTVTHPRLNRIPLDRARQEITACRAQIAERLGRAPSSFAYPKGNWNPEVARLVQEAGFACAATVMPGSVRKDMSPFLLPRIQVSGWTSLELFSALLTRAIDWYESVGPRRAAYRRMFRRLP